MYQSNSANFQLVKNDKPTQVLCTWKDSKYLSDLSTPAGTLVGGLEMDDNDQNWNAYTFDDSSLEGIKKIGSFPTREEAKQQVEKGAIQSIYGDPCEIKEDGVYLNEKRWMKRILPC